MPGKNAGAKPTFWQPKPSPLQKLKAPVPLAGGSELSFWVKRDDLLAPTGCPLVQGNKWRKLKGNLHQALACGADALISFGGAHSNHIAALAQATAACGIPSLGIIRGDELAQRPQRWSQTLRQAQADGMQLEFVSRAEYRQKQSGATARRLHLAFSRPLFVPEGGSNALAVAGVSELVEELAQQFAAMQGTEPTHIVAACGTGGTLAGLIRGVQQQGWNTRVIGIPVLKGGAFLHRAIRHWLPPDCPVQWELWCDYHDGGYARLSQPVFEFARQFARQYAITLDPVYTAKAFYAVFDAARRGLLTPGSRVVLVHTGGLQGGQIKA